MTDNLEARARRLLAGNPNKRVEIMVSGPVSRLGVVRKSFGDLQSQLLAEARRSGGNLQLRVTAWRGGGHRVNAHAWYASRRRDLSRLG